MNYTTVYQQQQAGHGAHRNSSIFGINALSWGKYFGDWPWPFSPT